MSYLLETFATSSGSTASKRAFSPRADALKASLPGKRSCVEGQNSEMHAARSSDRLRALAEWRLACRKLQARRRSHFRWADHDMAKIGCLAAGGLSALATNKQTNCAQQPKGVRGLLPQGVHWGLPQGTRGERALFLFFSH